MNSSSIKVGVVMGSSSDWEVMQHAANALQSLNIAHEVRVVSAHRTPDLMFDYRGVLCVEFFVDEARTLLVNELAPRPHNSGHGTLDASRTSQFEQQVRTLAGLPLGDTTMGMPVVMQNLLGEIWDGGVPRWQALLADSSATLHLYGKAEARHGRKMGHFSCVAPSVDEALDVALRLRRLLPASARTDSPGEIAAALKYRIDYSSFLRAV